ncbi:MAG TPA: anthranilate synthase component I family protein [Panacibacter sp.]|nr:anthranilate synthase component I family protein [Panacibacter sp.]
MPIIMVQRNTVSFSVTDIENFKKRMLSWANQFGVCCFLDNNGYGGKHHSYECLLAAGAAAFYSASKNILVSLQDFYQLHNDWLFGHFSYDLKNDIENLTSSHKDKVGFPDTFLFQPQTVIKINGNLVTFSCLQDEPSIVFKNIQATPIERTEPASAIYIQPRISKETYLQTIQKLQQHILRGDCYEINYCMEFFAEDTVINPLEIYQQLISISPNPFSCFYKLNDKSLLCASPERYLKKEGSTIISQPIKGTIRRNNADINADETNKKQLYESTKDRSENVMVVDLVRNDLSKICKENSVQVEELFGIYTFPQLHQMISTIKGELRNDIDLPGILKATFPMGSMTGAPKKRVMELIEQYEYTKRGIYSGAVGYISPEKDFDFNVVIRSIMYNQINQYLSYQVGSGITFYSNAEEEYKECLLKAKAIEKVLQ